MDENEDGFSSTYKPYKLKGQSFAPAYTVLQCLDHGGPTQQQLCVSACSFCINDDSCLLTQKTFLPSANRLLNAGFVQIWDLLSDENYDEDSVFTYSPVPEFSLSPDGRMIASILNSGQGMLYMVERILEDGYPYLEPCKYKCLSPIGAENMNGRPCCCVFSPDGCVAVTVSKVTTAFGRIHELHTWRVDKPSRTLHKTSKRVCEHFISSFSGQIHNCTFQVDGSLFALTTTQGQLFILKTSSLEIYSALYSDSAENTVCLCAFHPEAKLSVCTPGGVFRVWVLYPRQPYCFLEKKITTSPCEVAVMKYSQDYSLVAFGTTMGQVIVYNTDDYHYLYTISCSNSERTPLQACSVAFSKSCNEIAIGYNDSCVRIWQLPVKMDLQHLCRMEILSLVPETMICKLPLPESLKAYLMFKATFRSDDTC